MKGCPECGSRRTKVVTVRSALDSTLVRRRVCNSCGHRWYTIQPPEIPVPSSAISYHYTDRRIQVLTVNHAYNDSIRKDPSFLSAVP